MPALNTLSRNALAILPILAGLALPSPSFVAHADNASPLPVYAYDISHNSSDFIANGRVDPTQPSGQRVNVFYPPKETWNDEFKAVVNELDKAAEEEFWCSDLETIIPQSAQLIDEDDTIATYAFQPRIAPDANEEAKLLRRLQGRVTRSKPTGEILHLSLEANNSFKLNWLVKINSMHIETQCAATPDGRTYAHRSESRVFGSAAFDEFQEIEVTTISNIEIVGQK